MITGNRPRGWYDMTYDQQREWETREREHERERDNLEARERQARADADRDVEQLKRRIRGLNAEAEDYQDENARLAATLTIARGDLVHAINLLSGLVGLVQLVEPRGAEFGDLKNNHRYADAVAWLKTKGR